MIVDASAVLAVVLGEADAEEFISSFRDNMGRLLISPINLWEIRVRVLNSNDPVTVVTSKSFDAIFDLVVVPVDASIATLAFDAHRRFGRGRHRAGLNMGDCFAYALAMSRGEPLLFKGDDFIHTDVKRAL